MNKKNQAKILMILVMFTFGTMAPFVRNINVSSSELALYRAILAITMVGLYIFSQNKNSIYKVSKKKFIFW